MDKHETVAAPDPSMEDILASIRRILSEDEAADETAVATAAPVHEAPAHGAPAHAVAVHAAEAEEILDLDEAMIVEAHAPEPVQAAPRAAFVPIPDFAPEPEPKLEPEHVPEPEPEPAQALHAEPEPAAAPVYVPDSVPPMHETLVAPEAAAGVSASVGSLVRHLASERTTHTHRGGPTIEDMVREELRPMLKAWLDAHLPALVERLVATEIERVVSRATF